MSRLIPRTLLIAILLVLTLAVEASPFGPAPASAANIVVGTLADTVGVNGFCSLREAISNANADAAINPDCAAGSGVDTITFSVSGTIFLTGAALQMTDSDLLTIDGGGAITVSRSTAGPVFNIAGGTAALSGLTITGGSGSFGGGILNGANGTLTLVDSTVSGNSATNGGGIFNSSGSTLLTVVNSTISGNSADVGGGIYNLNMLTMLNSTVSGNSSSQFGGGGLLNDGIADISFSTFFGNTTGALNGGNIYTIDPGFDITTVKNSIVAAGTPDNCFQSGTLIDAGGNMADDATCSTFTQVTLAELNLGPLADNGGPTETHALLPGSVAIDAAPDCEDIDGATVDEDQRGEPRPADGDLDGSAACDVGAFELQEDEVEDEEPEPEPEMPDLIIMKVCPNGAGDGDADFNIVVRQGATLVGFDSLDCNEDLVIEDLVPGNYTIQELITGPSAGEFSTSILCDGIETTGAFATVTLVEEDMACGVINTFGAGGGVPLAPTPTPGPGIDIDNTNTNALNNDNLNTNNNKNTNTQEQSNVQEQTNDNNQTTTVDSSPSVVIDFD